MSILITLWFTIRLYIISFVVYNSYIIIFINAFNYLYMYILYIIILLYIIIIIIYNFRLPYNMAYLMASPNKQLFRTFENYILVLKSSRTFGILVLKSFGTCRLPLSTKLPKSSRTIVLKSSNKLYY